MRILRHLVLKALSERITLKRGKKEEYFGQFFFIFFLNNEPQSELFLKLRHIFYHIHFDKKKLEKGKLKILNYCQFKPLTKSEKKNSENVKTH